MNLQELTGYESGVVVFKESGEDFITNWSSVEGIPRIFVTGIVGLNDGDDLEKVEQSEVDNDFIESALELARADHEENKVEEEPEIDKIFENNECIVVAFKGWG